MANLAVPDPYPEALVVCTNDLRWTAGESVVTVDVVVLSLVESVGVAGVHEVMDVYCVTVKISVDVVDVASAPGDPVT